MVVKETFMELRVKAQPVPLPLVLEACPRCGRQAYPYLPTCLCGERLELLASGHEDPNQSGEVGKKSPGTFRMAHWSDLHVGLEWPKLRPIHQQLKELLPVLVRLEVDLLVISGDLTQWGRPKDFRLVRTLLSDVGFGPDRLLVVPGNHDVRPGGTAEPLSEVFETAFPVVKEVSDGIVVVGLDSNCVDRRTLFERGWTNVRGQVGNAARNKVLEMLRGTEEQTRLLVLHHHLGHLASEQHYATLDQRTVKLDERLMSPLLDAGEVLELASELSFTAAFHGHKHWYSRTGYRVMGLPVFNAGSITHMAEPRFRLLEFRKGRWTGVLQVDVRL